LRYLTQIALPNSNNVFNPSVKEVAVQIELK